MSHPTFEFQRHSLEKFATHYNLGIDRPKPRQQIPGRSNGFRIPQDEEAAQSMLRATKLAKYNELGLIRRFFVTNRSLTTFNYKEIHEELQIAIAYGDRPGLVEVLRDMLTEHGGKVDFYREKSTSFWKRLWKSDQKEIRSDYLSTAATSGDLDSVQIFVTHSDQTSLDQSLDNALQAKDIPNKLLITELLLAYGADAGHQHLPFNTAIQSRDLDMMKLLISATNPVPQECLSGGLLSAVKLGFLDVLFLLVLGGADANGADGNGEALKVAVAAGEDHLTAITLCDTPPSSHNLDEGMGVLFSRGLEDISRQEALMEILVSKGASGLGTDAVLVLLTKSLISHPPTEESTIKGMMKSLVDHGASINYDDAAALKLSVSNSRIDLINILLQAPHLDVHKASDTFQEIDTRADPETALEISSRLIDRGAQGAPVNEALIHAVKSNHIDTIKMLALRDEHRASVDYRNAQALKDAVAREKLLIVEILLAAEPNTESLSYAFPHIRNASKDGRVLLTQSLLSRGANGVEVHHALSQATQDEPPMRDERLLEILVEAGAAVEPHIEPTVFKGDNILLGILLRGNPSTSITSQSLLTALKYEDENIRSRLLFLLLDAGADGGHNRGRAILQATQQYDLISLNVLLRSPPHPESLDTSFAAAMSNTSTKECRKLCEILLAAGATGAEVHKGLIHVVEYRPSSLRLLNTLVPHASIDHNGGRALCIAVERRMQEYLSILLAMKPNSATFQNTFDCALKLKDESYQYCEKLLGAGPENDVMSKTLLAAVKLQKLDIVTLLLMHGASVDFECGAPVVASVISRNSNIVRMLVGNPTIKPSPATLDLGLAATLKLEQGPVKQEILGILLATGVRKSTLSQALVPLISGRQTDCLTIQLLLKYGASVYYNNNESLLAAAKSCNIEVLKMVLKYATDSSAVSHAFADRLEDDSFWHRQPGLKVMEILLKKGASGTPVDEALIIAGKKFQSEPQAIHFVKILLENRADVNFRGGLALQNAAEMGCSKLIRDILKRGCNSETLTLSLPLVLLSKLSEATVAGIVKAFASHPNQRFAQPFGHPRISLPVVAFCINQFPKNLEILVSVLDAGFPLDDTNGCRVGSEEGAVEVTPLFWTLSDSATIVDDKLIEQLIRRGARLRGHPESLLHLAIRQGRATIVSALIQGGSSLEITDRQGLTPLTFATIIGDVASMSALINAGSDVEDGVLHIAAHTLNSEAIKLLASAGCDPSKPSIKHQGRSPLAELLYMAPKYALRSSSLALEKDARKAIQALLDQGAKTKIKIPNSPSGKSLLLHALDSQEPYIMAKAFLDCGQFHHINNDFNLYTDEEYTYSPTMYIRYGLCLSDSSEHPRLMQLLETYQAKDRFWKNEGEQPAETINPPANIQRAEEQRKEEAERRQQVREAQEFEVALKATDMNQKLRLKNQEYEMTTSHSEDRRRRELQYIQNKAHLNQTVIDTTNASQLHHAKSMGQADLEYIHQKNQQILSMEENMHYRREQTNAQTLALKDSLHHHREQKNNQKLALKDELYSRRQKKLIGNREHRDYEIGNEMRYIEAQRGLFDRKIEFGKETRRVAELEMEYMGWKGKSGERQVLGDKTNNGQLGNGGGGGQLRIMEV
ncbi:hypothetical protein BJ875DRAFT_191720 [Amylocarpus encephaloides]|uniref:Uncharacterized protein n=1 Tax=Amylocarpus encephaloides TaxID=45428 RepID=A0A9P7YPX9_9HELO|nr:hypothetical protein BJ875DRAFT_191720 [Amylocarpus encephaloides]